MSLTPRKLEDLVIISDNRDVIDNFTSKDPRPQSVGSTRNVFKKIRMAVIDPTGVGSGSGSQVFVVDEFSRETEDVYSSDDESD